MPCLRRTTQKINREAKDRRPPVCSTTDGLCLQGDRLLRGRQEAGDPNGVHRSGSTGLSAEVCARRLAYGDLGGGSASKAC